MVSAAMPQIRLTPCNRPDAGSLMLLTGDLCAVDPEWVDLSVEERERIRAENKLSDAETDARTAHLAETLGF